ncbi:Kunitz/Bovine pancreatic trypsin inhibitor domain protein [Trichuris suis]|nr:Kunitz/Bovine pancreatic trypsin inhibitor domain protein [Trichuris suis]
MDAANIEEPFVEYDEGLQAETVQSVNFPVIRYYFSLSELKCKTFLFRGVGGNFNNFLSYEQCFDYCMPVVCNKEKAGSDLNGRLIRCAQADECPKSHICIGSICCQSEDTDQLSLLCPNTSVRIDSNSDPVLCNMTNPCLPPGFCQLADASNKNGVCCSEKISVSPRQHEPLTWCLKNLTALVTAGKDEPLRCSTREEAECPISFFCFLNGANGTNGVCCFFRKEELTCPMFMKPKYGKDGLERCNPHEVSLTCQLGKDTCHFNGNYRIYYCCEEVFPRNAVEENGKRFPLDAKCADGSSPYVDPYLKSIRICNPNLHFTCPSSYACVFNPSSSNYYCCISNGTLPDNVEMTLQKSSACPAGLQPLINATIGQPIICQVSLPGICPLTSICQYSPLYWQFICCISSSTPGDSINLTSVLLPGDGGCINDFQCSRNFPGAYCEKNVCTCPAFMLLHQKSCG